MTPAGRHALVTGAAGGLGLALVEALLERGARVSLLDVDDKALGAVAERLRGEGHAVMWRSVDVRDAGAVANAVSACSAEHGPVELLFNNAGITHIEPFAADQLDAVQRVIDVNLSGSINVTAHALEGIRAHAGAVVVISSVLGFAPLTGRTGYAASKHGLHGFFNTLRMELADAGVHVMLVCPSFIRTGIRVAHDASNGPAATPGGEATPAAVAAQILDALARGKRQLCVGRVAWLSNLLVRISPTLYEALARREAG